MPFKIVKTEPFYLCIQRTSSPSGQFSAPSNFLHVLTLGQISRRMTTNISLANKQKHLYNDEHTFVGTLSTLFLNIFRTLQQLNGMSCGTVHQVPSNVVNRNEFDLVNVRKLVMLTTFWHAYISNNRLTSLIFDESRLNATYDKNNTNSHNHSKGQRKNDVRRADVLFKLLVRRRYTVYKKLIKSPEHCIITE